MILTIAVILVCLYAVPTLWMTSLIWLMGGAELKNLWEAFTIGVRWPAFIWGMWV